MVNEADDRVLRLNSPNENSLPLIYPWSEQKQIVRKEDSQDDIDPCDEILETIKLVSSEFPEMADLFTDEIESVRRTKQWEEMNDIVERYNAALKKVLAVSKEAVQVMSTTKASVPLIQLIMRQIYNLVIEDPNKLNDYRGFSEEVYGEFKFPIISDMIERVPITESDTFIDLGSGVGQIVLQTAAQSMCKLSYGIEKRSIPHEYAMQMEIAFKERMNWFAKPFGDFRIIQGDFLSPESQAIIRSCNIIFCNNYTFPSELNLQLKTIFEDLPDGTVIISSNNFCPLNFRISERSLNDIGAIMTIEKVTFNGEGVSWTDKPIDYYIHRINRKRLFDFIERRANGDVSTGVSGMSAGSSDESASDEEFRPSKSSRGRSEAYKKRDRSRGSRAVSPAVGIHSPKVRSPIAKPRPKPSNDFKPAVHSEPSARKPTFNGQHRPKLSAGQAGQSISRSSSLTKLHEKAPAPAVPARAKQDLGFALSMYLAKQEAAIKDFLQKYDVSGQYETLKAENAALADRLATLETAVDALRANTHKMAHEKLCEALGVSPTAVEWGSLQQAALVSSVFVEHERLRHAERELRSEIAELEASDPRTSEEKRIKALVSSLKAFFKFVGQDIKTWKRKFELDTPEAADKYQAELRSELQKTGFPLEQTPKRPNLYGN